MKSSQKLLLLGILLGFASLALASSSVDFDNIGRTMIVRSNGPRRLPDSVIFSGSFVGPVTWTVTTLSNGIQNFAFTGAMTAGMPRSINVHTLQLTGYVVRGTWDSSTTISGDSPTREESVPEPSTLVFLGTGSLGLLGAVRRKIADNS